MIINEGYKAFVDDEATEIDSGKLRYLLPVVSHHKWTRIRKRLSLKSKKLLTPAQAVKMIVLVLAEDDREISDGNLAIAALAVDLGEKRRMEVGDDR